MTKYKCQVCGAEMEAEEGAEAPQHCGKECVPVESEAGTEETPKE